MIDSQFPVQPEDVWLELLPIREHVFFHVFAIGKEYFYLATYKNDLLILYSLK